MILRDGTRVQERGGEHRFGVVVLTSPSDLGWVDVRWDGRRSLELVPTSRLAVVDCEHVNRFTSLPDTICVDCGAKLKEET